jgi:hypothetical protein
LQLTTGIIDNLQELDAALRGKDEIESRIKLDAVLTSLQKTIDAINTAIKVEKWYGHGKDHDL